MNSNNDYTVGAPPSETDYQREGREKILRIARRKRRFQTDHPEEEGMDPERFEAVLGKVDEEGGLARSLRKSKGKSGYNKIKWSY